MPRQYQVLLRQLGLLLHVPGLAALATLPLCWALGEPFGLLPFAAVAALGLGLGRLLAWACRDAGEASLCDAMIVAALGWLAIPLLGALPFLAVARSPGVAEAWPAVAVFAAPANALFEAFSGFTSTGLTMSDHPSELPRTLQWWRSLSQWLGGVGVIVLMLAVVRPGVGAHRLYQAEAREEKILPTVKSTVRAYLGIYAAWTAAGIAALALAGAPPWQAVNHGLTAIATGGFTITDDSAASLSTAVQLVLMGLMIAGAVSFAAHGRALRERRPSALWKDGQHRLLWILMPVGVLLLAAEHRLVAGETRWLASAFQAVSALCTAGFQSAGLGGWSDGAKLLLVVGMAMGGAAGSTAGGIKLARVYFLYKGVAWRFRGMMLRRHEVQRFEVDGRGIPGREALLAVEAAAVLAVAWVAFLGAGAFALLHLAPGEVRLADALLEAASAQGNVGLSAGITGAHLSLSAKGVLMGLMWVGRLEILPVLILLAPGLRPPHPGKRRPE